MNKIGLSTVLGLKGEQFKQYETEIRSANTFFLQHLSALGALVGFSLSFLSLPFVGVLHLLVAYLPLFLFCMTTLVLSHTLLKKRAALILPGYYILMILLYVLTAWMGTALGKDTNATTFLLIMLLLPMFVIDRPWRLILVNLVATVGFIVAAHCLKSQGTILSLDVSNSIVVFLLSAVLIITSVQNQLNSIEIHQKEKDELKGQNHLINAIPAGIAAFEVRGEDVKQIYTNDGFYRLFEDTPEARAKRSGGDFFNSIYPEDLPRLKQAIKAVIDGQDFITMTCRSMKGNGSYTWVRFAAAVDRREQDYILVYSTYTSMEEEIRSRMAAQAKSEFLSRMSHDLRTPMNAILGLSELSEGEEDVEVLRANVRQIRESGNYLLSLINDTLDFQRIESGKMTLDIQVVEARLLLNSILDMIRPAAEKKRICFQVVNENADMDWYVRLDPVRFKQIFINLLSNAVKFTPEGGTVTFSFGCLGREGDISHDWLCVRDTGIGMSSEFIEKRMFKPFSQESNTVSPQYTGTGLGLSIVRSLVELMGGTIKVESTLGEGTAFMVYLDFERIGRVSADVPRKSNEKTVADIKQKLNGKHILLAEDHPLNADIVKRMLLQAGCSSTWVNEGVKCVKAFQEAPEHTFDLILMDMRMPVMDGQTATREIRKLDRPDARTIPIIAVTANAYEEDVQNCMNAGMNAHLAKPIDTGHLYETLVRFLCKA